MTEAAWLTCDNAQQLLAHLGDTTGWRKLRLAGCGCSRRMLPFLKDDWVGSLLTAAEAAADDEREQGRVDFIVSANESSINARQAELAQFQGLAGVVFAAGHHPRNNHFFTALWWLAGAVAWVRVPTAVITPDDWDTPQDCAWQSAEACERTEQAAIFRDIFGNPFRPVVFAPEWRTATAVTLARQMYDADDYSAMPILADALQDAGADNDDVLNHCRGPNHHVRGCWVVDMVLGRE